MVEPLHHIEPSFNFIIYAPFSNAISYVFVVLGDLGQLHHMHADRHHEFRFHDGCIVYLPPTTPMGDVLLFLVYTAVSLTFLH